MRNVLNKTRPQDKAEMAKDLKYVFDNFDRDSTLAIAKNKVGAFIDKWGRSYPKIAQSFQHDTIEYYFTYVQFPPSFRRMIYSTNSIESLNKKIRKATKNKQSFDRIDRLLDYVFVILKDFEIENWMKYPVSAFASWLGLSKGGLEGWWTHTSGLTVPWKKPPSVV